jgi:prepilin-type N-terminal cleavage/methylation domain-containing protein
VERQSGFTLVELMVTIAVLAILVAMATPSFRTMAERTALRGAADSLTGVIATAKEEAMKRDSLVRVDLVAMGTGVCAGARTVASLTDAGCNCATAAAACDVGAWPERERDMKNVLLSGSPSFGGDGGFVFDPKTGMLEDLADVGSVQLATAKYAVQVRLNAMGRTTTCSPSVSGKLGLAGVVACP